MRRRVFLRSALRLAAAPLAFATRRAAGKVKGPAETPPAFDFAWLKGQARAAAGSAYQPPPHALPRTLADLDYDRHQAIRFRREQALWAGQGLAFHVRFFHLGRGYKEPVQMYEVVNGQTRRIAYDPAMFDFRGSGIEAGTMPTALDFAGFRVHFHTNWEADIAAFLGASYFRAVGAERQYGLSTRGLAIDAGLDRAEEFPLFRAFWLERPARGARSLRVYALLDSPSIAGAYRLDITPGATLTMDVDAALYPRTVIERLGVAPLSSMYLHGENDRRVATDWRPEIHDSDGLALWAGSGERLWRPLVNPAGVRVNSYVDANPRGFGLLQRDRVFDHYQDDGVYYERRPSVWIEPKALANRGWGKGAVQLLEIPTTEETFDNVAAFWHPADQPQPGQELLFSYRLHWGAPLPAVAPVAQVVATRTGIGGVVGQRRRYFSWRFTVDFVGGELARLSREAAVEPVISASRGLIELPSARPQFELKGYRAMFDLRPTDESLEPIDLRLYLRLGRTALTETWSYQWTPVAVRERQRCLSPGPGLGED